tara:strand:- start:44 stop:373 length:330 start_codon:yes stop_codon:yes gene_type:complete
MKSRLEKVYSKLPNQKVNLKAHKVALGIVQDIIQVFKEGQDQFTTAASMEDRALEEYENSLQTLLKAQELADEANSQAQDLGVEIPSETQVIFERIDSFISSAQDKLNN